MHFPNGIIGSNIPSLQTDYWTKPDGEFHKLGQWPKPTSLRAETRYRNFEGQHDFPIATRYLIHIVATGGTAPTFFDDQDMWAWLDIEFGTSNSFEGESFTVPFLPRCFVQIHHTETLEELQVPGTSVAARWFNSRGFYTTFWEWSDQGGIKFKPDINTEEKAADHRRDQNNDYGYTDVEIELYAVSECYEFPNHPDLDPGMAAFDGSTAYISLSQLMTFTNNPFRIACEVRLNQTANHWPILGKEAVGGFMGMRGADIIFGNLTLPTSWTPVTDVWLTWVYEFEPVTQLQHKLTIAGVVVRDSTNSRQFPTFNNLGVYKHGVGGTLWADMDMRDLKIETGTPGNYTTLLEMPLRDNALDLGPQANHGTTFNMPLPSI